ncbi:hydrolase 2, exosortase A system-associated [Massilia sp. TS11]|uniref:hydrolase 2, exosortase A system-associated n=1 Tax=Massilia sp. TS11 TaxID=2908003 RepID=UPI001EDAD67B|nr:hydrolase 2, exosortase A system-associated [Massilia sp. TS11]MCG2584728.1 hydrolase 2, exosortase A system-associated [Massilia sp. TS11]
MNAPFSSTPPVEPFYLDAEHGLRFCLHHPPHPLRPQRGAIIYLPPLGDEMERTRRMAHLQARAFAAQGFAVLQLDLFGCGDSSGQFADARWPIWQADVLQAQAWLAARYPPPYLLWGCRFGSLLALEHAARFGAHGLILWHPFLSGRSCLSQFLRSAGPSIVKLRSHLWQHGHLDVDGYSLSAELARDIDCLDLPRLQLPACDIDWFALPGPAGARSETQVLRLAQDWQRHQVRLRFHPVNGLPFWSSRTILTCPALLRATRVLSELEPV